MCYISNNVFVMVTEHRIILHCLVMSYLIEVFEDVKMHSPLSTDTSNKHNFYSLV